MKKTQYKYIVFPVLLILGFAFYWYEYRPDQIRAKCVDDAQKGIGGYNKIGSFDADRFHADQGYLSRARVEELYSYCLVKNGINK